MTKEQIIEKIREIYKDEEFRMDGLFLCGFASGMPNEKLMNACKKYLDAVDSGQQPEAEIREELIAQLERSAVQKPGTDKVANIIDNTEDVKLVLAQKDLL